MTPMIVPLLLAADFMNFSYPTNPCYRNVPVPVVMSKGYSSYYDEKMGAGFDLHVDSVKRGSLAAGTHQAVVVIACDFPVGGTAAAYAFDERAKGAVLLGQVGTADWGPDWGAGPQSIRVRFVHRLLYVDQCKNNTCKDTLVTAYALRGGKLVKVSARSHQAGG
jgi:hypothetical protein